MKFSLKNFSRKMKTSFKKVRLESKVEVSKEVSLGDYTFVGKNTLIGPATQSIGSFCSIASGCIIGPNSHNINRVTTSSIPYTSSNYNEFKFKSKRRNLPNYNQTKRVLNSKKVIIHDDVWLGHNVLVMPGVEIGTGAVVGAGSVVTKDVDPYNIVVGVPARVLKKRFGEETISRLNEARVYERDSDKLLKLFHRYSSLDIEQVLDEFIDELSHIEFR